MAQAQKPDFVFRRNGRIHSNRRGRQFSRLLASEVCASAVAMLDTPCSEVVRRILATHSIRQFPLHFPSRASPCTITFQLESTKTLYVCLMLRPPQTPSSEHSNNNRCGKGKGEGHPVTFYDWHRRGRSEVLLIINLGATAGVKATPRNSSRRAVQISQYANLPHLISLEPNVLLSTFSSAFSFSPLTMKVQIIAHTKHTKIMFVCVCVLSTR